MANHIFIKSLLAQNKDLSQHCASKDFFKNVDDFLKLYKMELLCNHDFSILL